MDWVLTYFFSGIILFALSLQGCASVNALTSAPEPERARPIANPFSNYHLSDKGDPSQNMILRTKKGDRSVELEIPASSSNLSDFVLPVSPAFKNKDNLEGDETISNQNYKSRHASISDHEIIQNFPQIPGQDVAARTEIEKNLHLTASEDSIVPENAQSYLASMDHIKSLFKVARYEAALLESDELLRLYQNDPKIYEMRGTLFDRLDQRDLALKSWNQALRLNPNNAALRRFIEHKQLVSSLGGSQKK